MILIRNRENSERAFVQNDEIDRISNLRVSCMLRLVAERTTTQEDTLMAMPYRIPGYQQHYLDICNEITGELRGFGEGARADTIMKLLRDAEYFPALHPTKIHNPVVLDEILSRIEVEINNAREGSAHRKLWDDLQMQAEGAINFLRTQPRTPPLASSPTNLDATTTPGVELGAAVSDKRWLNSFEGMVVFEGTARCEENKLHGAKGKIGFKAIANSITPEVFMHHCFERVTGEEGDFESALETSNEENEESKTPDEFIADYVDVMPDLDKKAEIRVFSLFHGNLAHGFDSGWESEFDSEEWPYEQKIPPGVLLAEGVGSCEGVLDFQQITQRVLETYFLKQRGVSIPYAVDLKFCFYADHPKSEGEGARFLLTEEDEGIGEIAVAEVACTIDRYLSDDKRRMRIVAGPCENALRLVKHPDSPLQIEPDPEPPPTRCISAIVTVPASSGELPKHVQELFAVGAQGEIGQVMCWTSANQVESLPT
jgi:hypothetical protein